MNKKDTLTDRIMHTLEKKNISPIPRWEFMLKNGVLWTFGAISLLIGGVASAVIIFATFNSDILLYSYLSDGIFNHILRVLPLIWIISLILFLAVAVYQIKHTKRGYRYSLNLLILGNLAASILVGMFLYNFGMAHIIDVKLSQLVPMYRGVESQREENWMQAERGLLAGYIISTSSESFHLRDFNGEDWNVLHSTLSPIDIAILNNVEQVGIVGELISGSTFKACGIRPWEIRGGDGKLQTQMRNRIIAESSEGEFFERMPMRGMHREMMEDIPYNMGNHMEVFGNERKLSELRTIKCAEEITISDTVEDVN